MSPADGLTYNGRAKNNMNILVYGAGAMGCHIGYCMYMAGHNVNLICRGQHYLQMKQHGMHITICDNEIIKHDHTIKEDGRFAILSCLTHIKDIEIDYIFITTKLIDFNINLVSKLGPFMGKQTAVIPPCTKLPFWWFYNLKGKSNKKYNNVEIDAKLSKYFIKTNIICMTMWLSAVVERPGYIVVKHVQRGYPLAAIYPNMANNAERLRAIFNETCMSPMVDDIRSEIFIKAINSFAFNMVAIDKQFNNLQLSRDRNSKYSISKIMLEGDQILESLNIPIIQSVQSRISQTLSSTKHTMSMLYAYQSGKPIELKDQWDSFHRIAMIVGVDMPYSKHIYEKVMNKVRARIKRHKIG